MLTTAPAPHTPEVFSAPFDAVSSTLASEVFDNVNLFVIKIFSHKKASLKDAIYKIVDN
jgi:hypothetical protein